MNAICTVSSFEVNCDFRGASSSKSTHHFIYKCKHGHMFLFFNSKFKVVNSWLWYVFFNDISEILFYKIWISNVSKLEQEYWKDRDQNQRAQNKEINPIKISFKIESQ